MARRGTVLWDGCGQGADDAKKTKAEDHDEERVGVGRSNQGVIMIFSFCFFGIVCALAAAIPKNGTTASHEKSCRLSICSASLAYGVTVIGSASLPGTASRYMSNRP